MESINQLCADSFVCRSARWTEHWTERLKGHLLFLLVTHSVIDSAQVISVRKASLWREFVTRNIKKCLLPLLIGDRINRVEFREGL